MGAYKPPVPVKLVVGMLAGDLEILKQARSLLEARHGPEETVMDPIPFTWTRYYVDELGEKPWRVFVGYENLLPREQLVDIKRWTNELELSLAQAGKRRINLDPGYLTLGQFFLATTKDQRHRVYIRDGIFVEPTLYFENGEFLPFPWTYRDYRSDEYKPWFLEARSKLAYQMHHHGKPFSRRKEFGGGGESAPGSLGDPGAI